MNLIQCYDEHNGFLVIQQYINEQNSLPLKMRYKFTSVNEILTLLMSKSEILFEKNSDFHSLNEKDRCFLIETKFKYVSSLNTCFILHQIGLFDNLVFYRTIEIIFGSFAKLMKKIANDQFNSDIIFIKLAIQILIFSTFDYIYYKNNNLIYFENIKEILSIQNSYIDLTWKYLIYEYDHKYAVNCFSNLIRYIFSINNCLIDVIQYKQLINMIEIIIKKSKRNSFS